MNIYHGGRKIRMKQITVKESEVQLTNSDIKLLEEKLGVTLPEDYKNFLLLHNGGHPEKDCFPTVSKFLENENIAWFYAFYDGEVCNIIKENEFNKEIIPEEFIAIAYGPFGHDICLGVSGDVLGRVYFFVRNWDLDEDGQPVPDDLFRIANSFTDFINSLYSTDVEFEKDDNEVLISKRYIIKHDKYSLPVCTEAKKYGSIFTEFFANAPVEVEEYIFEAPESFAELTLYYDVKSTGKRYKRIIKEDQTTVDSVENLE
jgi:hypothetical protein